MGGKFWVNSIRLIFLSPNHPSLFTFVILINQCIKKIKWWYAHRVSQRIYAHRTCYWFSKSPRYTARARIRTKRCIPVDIQLHSGDRTHTFFPCSGFLRSLIMHLILKFRIQNGGCIVADQNTTSNLFE